MGWSKLDYSAHPEPVILVISDFGKCLVHRNRPLHGSWLIQLAERVSDRHLDGELGRLNMGDSAKS
jgi:hypothetical protein